MDDRPPTTLVPIYATVEDAWGFTFTRTPRGGPAAWFWAAAGRSFEVDPGTGRRVLRLPGRESVLFAHEAFWLSCRGHDFPGFILASTNREFHDED